MQGCELESQYYVKYYILHERVRKFTGGNTGVLEKWTQHFKEAVEGDLLEQDTERYERDIGTEEYERKKLNRY